MFLFPAGISVLVDGGMLLWVIYLLLLHKISTIHLNIDWIQFDVIIIVLRMLLLLVWFRFYLIHSKLQSLWFPYTFITLLMIFLICQGFVHHFISNQENIFILLSSISYLSQAICIYDLKSSIVPIKTVALGLTRKYDKISYQFKMKHSNSSQSDLVRPLGDNDDNFNPIVLAQLQDKFHSAKNSWNLQAEKLKHMFVECQNMVIAKNLSSPSSPSGSSSSPLAKEIFDAILLTIIGETKQDCEVAIDNLLQIFDEYPAEIEFYIPQIALFLLYGAFELEEQFKGKLLLMCEKHLSFAYKLFWFIDAFCLNRSDGKTQEKWRSPLFRMDSESFAALDQFQQSIQRVGEQACFKFLKLIEEKSIKKCTVNEESGHHLVSYGSIEESIDETVHLLTPHPSDSFDNTFHSEKFIAVSEECTPFPLHRTKLITGPFFSSQLRFWNELILMTRELFLLPKNQRQFYMIQMLQKINEKYLPSSVIHIPLGNTKHRIWKIHPAECFTFATKERTPVLICFEVLFYEAPARPKEKSKKWWSSLMNFQEISRKKLFPKQDSVRTNSYTKSAVTVIPVAESGYLKSRDGFNLEVDETKEFSLDVPQTNQETSDKSFQSHQRQTLGQWSSPRPVTDNPIHAASRSWTGKNADSPDLEKGETPVKTSSANGGLSQLSSSLRIFQSDDFAAASFDANRGNAESLDDRFDYLVAEQRKEPTSRQSKEECPKVKQINDNEVADLTNSTQQNRLQEEEINRRPIPLTTVTAGSGVMEENLFRASIGEEEQEEFDEITSKIVFKEKWRAKEIRIKKQSELKSNQLFPYPSQWKLIPIIIKSNDDLRQEQIASQIITFMSMILNDSKVPNKLKPYSILALSSDSGIIEAIPNTVSIDVLKRKELLSHHHQQNHEDNNSGQSQNFQEFFEHYFEMYTNPKKYYQAQENFIISMANYSIICYLLHIKDRHNGNILLTTHGQIIHIDFGFILGKTPGGNLDFEKAPFKLVRDYVEIMGGEHSRGFQRFRQLCVRTFLELRRHYQRILLYVETISKGNEHLACFNYQPQVVIQEMCDRFFPQMNDHAAEHMVHDLIHQSLDHWTTNAYDQYQRLCQGIF